MRHHAAAIVAVLLFVTSGCGKADRSPAAASSEAPKASANAAPAASNDSAAPAGDKAAPAEVAPVEAGPPRAVELINVSYDPTRELWKALNAEFAAQYAREKNVEVTIRPSHGGSSAQARSVIEGHPADVVSLAMFSDTDAIRKAGLIKEGWSERLPNHSLPYWSTIVFVVRKGNPKNIHEWKDLVREGVEVITPNPKTSGNGKLSFLGAWGSVIEAGQSEKEAEKLVTELYDHVSVLDTGARGASTTFAEKQIGDVHLTWENEAHLETKESAGQLEIVYPSVSIQAEPCVAIVDANVDHRGTRQVAEDYLNFLYTPKAQTIIASNFYRPYKEQSAIKFPKIKVFKIQKIADSWSAADKRFFSENALFDKIMANRKHE